MVGMRTRVAAVVTAAVLTVGGVVERRRGTGQAGRAALHRRCVGRGRRLLPVRRQRRLRRPALRPRPDVHAARSRARRRSSGQLDRRGDDRPGRHPGPRPLQPRPARHGRAVDHDQRQAGHRGRAARARRRRSTARRTGRCRTTPPAIWELTIQPRPKIKKGQSVRRRHQLRRRDHPAARHRGRAVRLGHHPRRRHGGQRARGLDDLVPGQRPPDRQGDLRLRDHRARRARSPSPTASSPEPAETSGRLDDLVLERARPAGQLPDDGLGRRLRPARHVRPTSGLPIIDAVDTNLTPASSPRRTPASPCSRR